MILIGTFALGTSFYMGLLRAVFFRGMSQNFFMLFHTTLNDLAAFGFIVYFVTRKYGGQLKDVGINFIGWAKDIRIGIVGYLATLPLFLAVLFVLVLISSLASYEPPPHPLVEVFIEEKENPWLVGYSIFLACVIGPFLEEVFFRGFFYPLVRKVWGVRLALIVTAAFFAFIHRSLFAFWPIFVLGLVLTYLYEKRGTLIPCVTMHVVHNTLFIGYFFVVKKVFLDEVLWILF
jgi:hypothetical protein